MQRLRFAVIAAMIVASSVHDIARAATPPWTTGAAVEVREGDIWSAASIVSNEGRKWKVRYADGTEEWVTADRIRAAGGASSSDAAAAATDAPAASGEKPPVTSGVTLAGPFSTIALRPNKTVPARANAPMTVRPTTRPTAAFTDLTPPSGADLGRIERLIVCADRPNVVVAVGAREGSDTPLMIVDVNDASKGQARVFSAADHEVIAAADGGRMLVTRPTTFGAKTLHLWEYKADQYQLVANFNFITGPADDGRRPGLGNPAGATRDASSAILLSPTRLLIRSGSTDYLLDVPGRREIAHVDGGEPRLHASDAYVIVEKDGGLLAMRPSDLAVVGQIGKSSGEGAVDPTGAYAAVREGGAVRVVKAGSGQEVAQAGGIATNGRLDLLGPSDLLADGKFYYDLKTGIPAWTYDAANASSVLLANGQMFYATATRGETRACMVALPDQSAADAIARATPDRFALSPGAHVSIAGDLGATGNADVARKALEKMIADAKHVLDPAAAHFVLRVDAKPGPTGKFTTLVPGTLPPVYKEHDAPSTILTVTLTNDGATLWTRELRFSASFIITRNGDESIDDAIARAGRPDASRLNGLALPSYIVKQPPGAKPGEVTTLGRSTLTATGFVPTATQ